MWATEPCWKYTISVRICYTELALNKNKNDLWWFCVIDIIINSDGKHAGQGRILNPDNQIQALDLVLFGVPILNQQIAQTLTILVIAGTAEIIREGADPCRTILERFPFGL